MSAKLKEKRTMLQQRAMSIATQTANRQWQAAGMYHTPNYCETWCKVYQQVVEEFGAKP